MRASWLAALFALVLAACGSLNEGGALGRPTPSGTPAATVTSGASVSPAASAVGSATAVVVGTIVPIVPGQTFPPPPPTAPPTPSPSPAPGGLGQAQLKFRVVDSVGRPQFCDPDYYPIARADEESLAEQRFPEIQKDAPTFSAILAHLGFAPAPSYTSQQKLAIYREWKTLNALRLEAVAGGYRFAFTVATQRGGETAYERVDGTVSYAGAVTVGARTAGRPPICPICLARGTRIATPSGEVRVEELRQGDLVWTIDGLGRRVAAPLVAIGSTPVPSTHEVVRLGLDDGRVVLASPGHPTADGRRVGELRVADALDGARVASAERVRYAGGATFDLLPAGPTGAYWANGVLLGSTLR